MSLDYLRLYQMGWDCYQVDLNPIHRHLNHLEHQHYLVHCHRELPELHHLQRHHPGLLL
jgi:hypothetical protein